MIEQATEAAGRGENLTPEQMQSCMEEIMSGEAGTQQIVSFLAALSRKGETPEELAAACAVLRSRMIRINAGVQPILDTCGTGGDALGTFNISTVVAFVASGAGITVAKHGNRSVSSCCGSADILEALGVNIKMGKEKLESCLNKIGIAFLFAQELHPAMKYAMPARKQIGRKTMFNLLGPLSNPAGAGHQLIGVYDSRWTRPLAEVLKSTGTIHSLVVSGQDGLDELTTTAKTTVSEVNKGSITDYEIAPEDFGIKRARLQDLAGGDIEYNAKVMLSVLEGRQGPKRDIVILNAAAAIYAANKASSIKEAAALAGESIGSGMALKKLELLKEYSLN